MGAVRVSDVTPAAVTGFGWSQALLAALNLLVGGALVTFIRSRPSMKKLANEREANLLSERAAEMENMRERIAKLDKRQTEQARRHDTHIEILRQLHEGEIALLRHRLNGEEQVNIALMSVLQTLDVPQKALDAIEATRERKREAIATEQAALTALRAAAVEKLAKLGEGE